MLGRVFFAVGSFITFNVSCYSLWLVVSVEKSANSLMGVPLYVVIFPLLLLIFHLSLVFVSLIIMCLGVFLGLSYLGLSVLPGLGYFLSRVMEVFSHYLFKYFLRSFLSSPSGTSIM